MEITPSVFMFTKISGHDVSILALHHAFKQAALSGAHRVADGSSYWWPPYASHIIVDLVTDRETGEFLIQICFDVTDQENCGVVMPLRDFTSQIAREVTLPYTHN